MSANDADAHRRHFGSKGCLDITCTSCVRQREGSPFKVAYFDDLKIGDVIHQWSMDGITFRYTFPLKVEDIRYTIAGRVVIMSKHKYKLYNRDAFVYMIVPAAVVPAIRNV